MINKAAYLNAVMSARELDAAGISLQARPTSVLGELMDLSVSFQTTKTTELPALLVSNKLNRNALLLSDEERADSVVWNTSNHEESSQHSLKLAALADDIAPFITQHISHARNTVKPLVVELADKLRAYVVTARPVDPVSMFEIEQRAIPGLLMDESFLSSGLEAYEGISFGNLSITLAVDVPEDDSYYSSLVNLGNDRLNELVNAWLLGKGEDFIKRVFITNFTNSYNELDFKRQKYSFFGENDLSGKNPYDVLDLSLAMYLICSRLFTDVVPAAGMSLSQYKAEVRVMIDVAGATIHRSLKAIQRQVQGQVLVSEAVISERKIVVNKALYQAWLQSGGSPEVLLGMLASGEVIYAVSAIESAKERLLRHWQNFVMLSQADVKAELRKRFLTYLEGEVLAGLVELTPLEQEYSKDHVNFRAQVGERLKAEIEHLSHRIMEDLDHTALHLIAKTRFYFTSAYSILSEMDNVSKENADIDPREAGLLSVIKYLAEYFEAQIVAVK